MFSDSIQRLEKQLEIIRRYQAMYKGMGQLSPDNRHHRDMVYLLFTALSSELSEATNLAPYVWALNAADNARKGIFLDADQIIDADYEIDPKYKQLR